MRIQRSTFDFLMISAILGSVVLVTSFFGYGAGTLVIMFWVLVILFRLKRSNKSTTDKDSDGYISGMHSDKTRHENDRNDDGSGDGGGD
ncbi:hypothetical protein [Halothiobacillus sp.]|jgi:hypothetical protein|uniref:hypothetical protein n=1 Tax=Halothiobacillus sp. TaxID=1891311 RepID=UPI002612EB91|nr:hypothetical protein [Halothiobacillus sp.]MDD4967372.1 hypothetical protein [Halothiobacillus sp.]MDY0148057.1 hypothetical protein [Halothiobacillus sp.]